MRFEIFLFLIRSSASHHDLQSGVEMNKSFVISMSMEMVHHRQNVNISVVLVSLCSDHFTETRVWLGFGYRRTILLAIICVKKRQKRPVVYDLIYDVDNKPLNSFMIKFLVPIIPHHLRNSKHLGTLTSMAAASAESAIFQFPLNLQRTEYGCIIIITS